MASPSLLNFEALLAPLAGDNPAGEPLAFEVRKKLDDSRKEVNPNQFAPNDPRRPEQPQPADWGGIVELAQDTLAQRTKDLLVAARLTEALTKRHNFAGLRDGIKLLSGLAQDGWDRIYPLIEDGDTEVRASAFVWLDDEVRGARFPNSIRTIPLTNPGGKGSDDDSTNRFGWQTWKDAQEARGEVTAADFEQAVAETPREYCQASVDDIAECIKELMVLLDVLSAKMGDAAPGLAQVRKALLDCQELAQYILKRKGPAPVAAQTSDAQAAEPGPAAAPKDAAPAVARPLTREDVLARLADASALLLQMEPHSPIAYLVQRAVKLARLPLPELMKVLVRDAGVLNQLDRDLDLGLESPEGAKSGRGK